MGTGHGDRASNNSKVLLKITTKGQLSIVGIVPAISKSKVQC